MNNKVLTTSLKFFSSILCALTVFTVNSACILVLGQEKEPESLRRFKKI